MDEQLKQSALDFHEFPVPGKIQVSPTKPLATQRDLALAYSPGVAAPCLEIEKDPLAAYKYTARGNLVAVISNGTAVLGLGNIGALAGKIGDRWSLGFVAETEQQVVQHLDSHLGRLPARDQASRAILEQMKEDEARHATHALIAGGARLPLPVRLLMKGASKIMTKTTYWV